ncbi:hypothetical protein PR048_009927 [Dryococelus australis]|uniref:Uncharacterized protein n=1 Tax=Dryococelus australis TaxID=614101 RepID=A0ABQ9I1B3_9NEOP|nr:hypothetical protein PR048_009927 [Dryococelus australis]
MCVYVSIYIYLPPDPTTHSSRKFKCPKEAGEVNVRRSSDDDFALKGLSVHHDFGNTLLEWLRDKLASGVKSDCTSQKLLTEENLTYDRALKLATNIERALAEWAIFMQKLPSPLPWLRGTK